MDTEIEIPEPVPTFEKKDVAFINNHGSSYTDLVEEAKHLLRATDLFKLKIAKMAIKACTIRHGGRSSGYYTLVDFARDVGCDRKGLSEWVLTYKRVVVHMEAQILTERDFNTARRVSDRIAKEATAIRKVQGNAKSKQIIPPPPVKVIKQMYKHEGQRFDPRERTTHGEVFKARQYAHRALGLLKSARSIAVYDKTLLLDTNAIASQMIEIALEIQTQTITLMEGKTKAKDKPETKESTQ